MSQVVRDVELRPHIGHDRLGNEVVAPQDQIFLNGVRVGYVGHEAGHGIALIRPCDSGTVEAIQKAVEERFGSAPATVAQAPPISDEADDE